MTNFELARIAHNRAADVNALRTELITLASTAKEAKLPRQALALERAAKYLLGADQYLSGV